MNEVYMDFAYGLLIFQAYVYTSSWSSFRDDFNTRAPILDALAILAFMFSAVLLYKTYAPCLTDKPKEIHTCPKDEDTKAAPTKPSVKHPLEIIKLKPDVDIEKNMAGVSKENVYGQVCYHDEDHSNKYCESNCNLLMHIHGSNSHKCKAIEERGDKASMRKQIIKQLWQSRMTSISSLILTFIDVIYIYVGLSCMQVFVKYYMLYSWTFTGWDLVELLFVPLGVIFLSVSFSVARTTDKILKAFNMDGGDTPSDKSDNDENTSTESTKKKSIISHL